MPVNYKDPVCFQCGADMTTCETNHIFTTFCVGVNQGCYHVTLCHACEQKLRETVKESEVYAKLIEIGQAAKEKFPKAFQELN